MAYQRVGVHWNSNKSAGLAAAGHLVALLQARRVSFTLNPSLARALDLPEHAARDHQAGCDLLIVLGGDGTILRVLETAIPNDIPILGVNLGRLGFLSETEVDQLDEDLDRVLSGDVKLEERTIMSVEGYPDDRVFALNEIVIGREDAGMHVVTLECESNGTMITRIAGDGLIVSSPTGSTAYSLSAGGPIVAPNLECFVLTPICPHMLNARPVVLSSDDPITVRLGKGQDRARVVLDGRTILPLDREHPSVTLRKSHRRAKFIRLHDRNFYDLLRVKLSEWTR